MPKLGTCVHRRSGTANLEFKIRPPIDLQHLYPGKQWACRRSLGTSDIREANRRGAALYAEWQETFARQRQPGLVESKPERRAVEVITPDLSRLIAETLRHDVLSVDDDIRTSPKKHALGGGMSAMLNGMPEYLADDLAESNRKQEAAMSEALAKSRRAVALPALESTAQKLGLDISTETPGLADALLECLRVLKEAAAATVARDKGESIPTPPLPTPAKPQKVRKMRDVHNEWKRLQGHTVTADTIRARERALTLFEQGTGNPPLHEVTRAMGHEFAQHLTSLGGARKTASDRLKYVSSMLKFASRELEWLDRHPWDGIEIDYTTETERKPWTPDHIRRFFALPLFTSYALPQRAARAGADAAYWVPLLGLFTGARVGELVQLRVADVAQTDGVWCLDINAEEGKRLKTENSRRLVPVHSELIRLGFLDYVQDIREAGHTSLWPVLHLNDEKPSNGYSRWFNGTPRKAVKDSEGKPVDIPDFHSLRHLVRSTMAAANIPEPDQDLITGHASRGSTGTRVYRHAATEKLRTAVEAIQYPTFSLGRTYSRERLGITTIGNG